MFDLEHEITQWRQLMSARLPRRSDEVAELESHLRDAVQRETQAGLSEGEAWQVALRQLGEPQQIAGEYLKLTRAGILSWAPARIVACLYVVMALLASIAVGARFVAGRSSPLLLTHIWSVTLGYLAVIAIGAIAVWSITARAFRGWSARETQLLHKTSQLVAAGALALTLVGVVTGGVWLRQSVGRIVVFDVREIAGIGIVAWNVLVLWLLIRNHDERAGLISGLVGGGLTAICWSIPILLPGTDSHGFGSSLGVLVVAVISLCLLASMLVVLAVLPPGRLRFRDAA